MDNKLSTFWLNSLEFKVLISQDFFLKLTSENPLSLSETTRCTSHMFIPEKIWFKKKKKTLAKEFVTLSNFILEMFHYFPDAQSCINPFQTPKQFTDKSTGEPCVFTRIFNIFQNQTSKFLGLRV